MRPSAQVLSRYESAMELDIASSELRVAIEAFARGEVTVSEVERRRTYRDQVFLMWRSATK